MWNSIEQKILQINKATGIEIIILDDDKLIINTDTASTRNNTIIKGKEINGLKELAGLTEEIDPAIPLSVVINGKGVLIKKIDIPIKNGLVQSVLPNANPNDFYFEHFSGQHHEIISIVRKETADRIIAELKKLGFKVISVSLGFSAINNILPFLKTNSQKHIESDSLLLEIGNNNEIIDFRNKDQINNIKYQAGEYLVANQYIRPANILSFSAATALLADDLKTSGSMNKQVLSADRREYRYFKFFRTAGWALLIIILSALLINFLAYNKYFNKNKSIAESRLFSTQQDQKFKLLEKEVRQKEKFLEQSGWTGTSRTSFYADRIAGLLPGDVLLTSMQIYPARNNSVSETGNNLFKKDTIIVNGVCDDPVELSRFMNGLKVLPDFKEVSIKNYMVRNESGTFTMEIITR